MFCTAAESTDVLGYVTINSGSATTFKIRLRMTILNKLKKEKNALPAYASSMKILLSHKIDRGNNAAGQQEWTIMDNTGQYSVGLSQTLKIMIQNTHHDHTTPLLYND